MFSIGLFLLHSFIVLALFIALYEAKVCCGWLYTFGMSALDLRMKFFMHFEWFIGFI